MKIRDYINNEPNYDQLTWIGIMSLIIIISGIFGFIYEFIFYYLNSGMQQFYYRGGNFLPWINIYAIGAILIFLFTFKKRRYPIKVFLISLVSCGILEYLGGWMLYTFGNGFRCWDYNTEILNFGNINGFICFRSILFFGLSSLLLIYFIVPLCFFIANRLDKRKFLILNFTLCSIFLADEIYNLVIARILNTPRASDIYKSIGFQYMNFK